MPGRHALGSAQAPIEDESRRRAVPVLVMRGLKLWLISFLAALEFILAVAVLHGIGPMGDGIAEPKVGLVAGTIPGALFTFVIVFLGLEWIEAQAPAAEHAQNRARRP